jgi:hypothetical protein
MLVFLICLFTAIVMLFAVLAYGAINDGQRLLFTGISVFFLAWVSILGFMLAMHETLGETAEHVSVAVANVLRVPPKAPEIVGPANLPMVAVKGTSFHLEAGQSTPIFRVPTGKKAHVSVYGGALTSYSGGVLKLSCDTRSFSITGTGDGGTQLVACDSKVDVLIDDVGG